MFWLDGPGYFIEYWQATTERMENGTYHCSYLFIPWLKYQVQLGFNGTDLGLGSVNVSKLPAPSPVLIGEPIWHKQLHSARRVLKETVNPRALCRCEVRRFPRADSGHVRPGHKHCTDGQRLELRAALRGRLPRTARRRAHVHLEVAVRSRDLSRLRVDCDDLRRRPPRGRCGVRRLGFHAVNHVACAGLGSVRELRTVRLVGRNRSPRHLPVPDGKD